MVSEGVGQSNFLWFNRGLATVQTIYSTIWQTPDVRVEQCTLCYTRVCWFSRVDFKT